MGPGDGHVKRAEALRANRRLKAWEKKLGASGAGWEVACSLIYLQPLGTMLFFLTTQPREFPAWVLQLLNKANFTSTTSPSWDARGLSPAVQVAVRCSVGRRSPSSAPAWEAALWHFGCAALAKEKHKAWGDGWGRRPTCPFGNMEKQRRDIKDMDR